MAKEIDNQAIKIMNLSAKLKQLRFFCLYLVDDEQPNLSRLTKVAEHIQHAISELEET